MIERPRRTYPAFRLLLAIAALIAPYAGCQSPDVGEVPKAMAVPASPDPLLVAEDGRSTEASAVRPLFEALDADPARRRRAVRGLGRMENPAWLPRIAALLDDEDASVRRESANAVGQAAARAGAAEAFAVLQARAGVEGNPGVLGTIGRTVGRLTYEGDDHQRAAALLSDLAARMDVGSTPDGASIDLALGFEALHRLNSGTASPDAAVAWLVAASAYGRTDRGGEPELASTRARLRRVATAALAAAAVRDTDIWAAALSDPDGQVRRIAIGALSGTADETLGEGIRRTLTDPDPAVRIQALMSYDATFRASRGCEPILLAARERVTRVALAAIDLLGRECAEGSRQRTTLEAIAGTPMTDMDWHRAAHAVVSLASIDAGRGRRLLSGLVTHPNPFVRAYGARAAALVDDREALGALIDDPDDNVREAAVRGLFELRGHAVDPVMADQLTRDDPQLVLTAARLLEGSPSGEERLPSLLAALDRLSAVRHETLRDPRVALLRRVAEFGDSALVPRIEPYLRDFDPAVATLAAETLTRWRGAGANAEPSALPANPLPTPVDIERLERTRVILEMRRGGRIVIRLLPRLAPTNAARMERLAAEGALDGLTFHRMAPNFVIQGGSPGANEYAGHGAYTRDEVGLPPHWRGTVGLSTRGRDTGDGQLFVNLVDNVRLNHGFTLFGEVVVGMDVVDAVLEGDVIERARVIRGREP